MVLDPAAGKLRRDLLVLPRVVAFFYLGIALCLSAQAQASELLGSELEVRKAASAADCPDADALVRSVSSLWMAPNHSAERLRIEVRFERDQSGYTAHIESLGAKPGTRKLATSATSCASLGDAVSVSLAVLLDLVPVARRSEPLPSRPSRELERAPGAPLQGALIARAGGGYGVLGAAPSGLFSAAFVLSRGPFALEAQGFWSTPHSVDFDPGFVEVGLWGGGLDGCYRVAPRPRALAFRPCVGLRVGRLSGVGSRFDANYGTAQAWVALAGSANLTLPLASKINVITTLSVLVPLREHAFSVAGRGAAFESLPLAAVLQVGSDFTIW